MILNVDRFHTRAMYIIMYIGTSGAKLQNVKMGFLPDYLKAGDVITVYLDGTLSELKS